MRSFHIIKTSLFTLCFAMVFSLSTYAQDYNASLGFRIGTNVTATFTKYVNQRASVEAFAGITRKLNQTDYIVGGFYKYHLILSPEIPTLNYYGGFGGLLLLEEENTEEKLNIGVGLMLGMEYTMENTPVAFFIDVLPYNKLTSDSKSKIHVQASLGARFLFGHLKI